MCLGTGLNCRHKDFQSFALPTELPKLLKRSFIKISPCTSNIFKDVCTVIFDKSFLIFLWFLTSNLFFKNFSLDLAS